MVRLISGLQARLFEVQVALDAVHGLVADYALVAQAASTHGAEAGVQGAEARLARTTPSSHGGLPMLATNRHPACASPLPWPAGVSEAPQCPIPRSSPRPDTRSPRTPAGSL